jgi:hypothetical protein
MIFKTPKSQVHFNRGYTPLPSSLTRTNVFCYNLQEVGCGGMDWIELGHDRDRWQALVNVVMNLQVL